MKKFCVIVGVVLIVALVLGSFGCAKPAPTPAATPAATPTRPANWPKEIYIAYAGGTNGMIGMGVTDIMSRYVAGVTTIATPVSTPDESIRRIAKGEFDITPVPGSQVREGLLGEGGFKDVANKDIYRALVFGHHSVEFVLVRADSGIKSYKDIKGKRLVLGGPRNISGPPKWLGVLAQYGVSPSDVTLLPADKTATDIEVLVEGRAEVMFPTGGYPLAEVTEAMKRVPMRILPMTPQDIAAANAALPGAQYTPFTLPAGAYPGQTEAVPIMSGGPTHIVIRKALPDDLVYAITKAIFEHLDTLRGIHVAFQYLTPQTALDSKSLKIPAHPGTIKYLRDSGVWSDGDIKKNQEILADIQSKL